MNSTSQGREPATAVSYPTTDQYERWKARASEVDMNVSEFIQNMVEAGIKVDRGFDPVIEPDSSVQELRQQRNELKEELDRKRSRIQELETRVYHSEAAAVEQYVAQNPGVSHDELIEHMRSTVPERLYRYVESAEIWADLDEDGQDGYYPSPEGAEE